jgi:Fe-S-cluster-containing dehydrogenase component
LPDAIEKTSWNNPLSISLLDAEKLGVADGDVVELAAGSTRLAVPVLVTGAQAPGVLGLSLGYGRRAGSVAQGIGVNAWPLVAMAGPGGTVKVDAITKTGQKQPLIRMQEHFDLGGRDLARMFTLAEFEQRSRDPRPPPSLATLYPDTPAPGPKWGMAIDLGACLGCGACVIACQSENNVPVVGPEQVKKGRSMHWLRIDRYDHGPDGLAVHEPMLCQHCGHAPCENVCPVQATNHSPDGLNQMAYNRCVGTRYCANNCPYKVRRFNYLGFSQDLPSPLELAHNPEVTVRPRGVIEKCTFCVQRIRNAEQVAKNQGRPLKDGEVQTACQVACPTQAIVFGNLADTASQVARTSRDPRGFRVLEELGVRPSITYLAALRNPPRVG